MKRKTVYSKRKKKGWNKGPRKKFQMKKENKNI